MCIKSYIYRNISKLLYREDIGHTRYDLKKKLATPTKPYKHRISD